MSNDQPTPRPPLPPPFSRPTHPGTLPVIAPDSEAGRPLRPTPYASAVIPALAREDAPAVAAPVAAVPAAPEPVAVATVAAVAETGGLAVEPESSTLVTDAPMDRPPADVADGSREGWDAAARPTAAAGSGEPGEVEGAAGQGADARIRSLRDLPVDHAHPTGVPPNPEPAVEGVGAAWDYPTDSVWSSDAVFGWGASVADWELVSAGSAHGAALPATDVTTSGPPTTGLGGGASDLAGSAAELLEALASAVRRGDVVLPSVSWPQTAPAVLAAVLTALLSRADGDQWEVRVPPASGQRR